MRGEDAQQHAMFSYVSPEERVPANHPLRTIWQITDRILKGLSSFQKIDEAGESAGRGEDDDPSNPTVDFYGEMRRNETHGATTDPGARRGVEGPGQGSEVELQRACAEGEAQRAGGGRGGTAGRWRRGAGCSADHGGFDCWGSAGDGGSRQGRGCERVRGRHSALEGHTARRPEPEAAKERDRQPGDPRAGLCHQPAEAEAGGGDFGLDADGGREEEAPAPGDSVGGLDVHFGCGGSQSGAHPQPDRSDDVTAGEKCVCQRKKLRSLLAQSHDQASEASN